ncbi:spore germination protein [Paenibacillus vandeheii]
MDVRSGNDGQDSNEAASEEKMHKSNYQIQEEEEKKAHQKKKQNEMSDSIEESVKYWQENDDISPRMSDNKYTLQQVLGLGESFDVNMREMVLGGKRVGLLLLTGFAKDEILLEVLKRLTYLTPEQVSGHALKSYFECYIPHIQVERVEKMSAVINKVLTGMSAMFVEGDRSVIIMDTRSYPVRSPEEPSLERVVRGSRDGFTETLLTNVALVRRRIRDPGLKFEIMQVGRRSQTDVCVVYIDDIVDKVQVDSVREKIKRVNIDGIPAADKQLEEAIINKGWHPYPLVRYSERPDVTASHLIDGRVVIFVDTSPSVMILPTTFFDLCEHAEENRQTAFMGTYLRWVRFGGILISLFLLPLWLLMVIDPAIKPIGMEFIGPHENAKLPLILQFLLIEFGVDLLRMAAVHTPTPLASAMGLIAAILVGDIAVKTGYFVNEVVLYMAIAAIGMFATPSYELGLANRLVRLFLLVAVAMFKVPGFVVGTTFIIVALTLHRSYNSSYLWPFIPFNAKALGNFLFRLPLLENKKRPSINKTRDNTKMDNDPDGKLEKSKKHK